MSYQEVLGYVEAEPFRPFRIHMASGRTFDVRHPEMIRVGLRSLHVFHYSEQDGRVYEKVEMLGLQLVELIEPLDLPVAQDQN